MGTHPIFESDFDCLTDGSLTTNMDDGHTIVQLVNKEIVETNNLSLSHGSEFVLEKIESLVEIQECDSTAVKQEIFSEEEADHFEYEIDEVCLNVKPEVDLEIKE